MLTKPAQKRVLNGLCLCALDCLVTGLVCAAVLIHGALAELSESLGARPAGRSVSYTQRF